MALTKQRYSHIKDWDTVYENDNIKLGKYWKKTEWKELISKDEIKKIDEKLTEMRNGVRKKIFPYPSLVFNAFEKTKPEEVKVVFLGQDPYPSYELYKERVVPQAMGLCFSVADGMRQPASLKNIFENMKKYGHVENIPESGNLEKMAEYGCLMLNTSLTVTEGEINSHQNIWNNFSNEIIKYISDKTEHTVFVIWGAYAFGKLKLVDLDKHEVVVTSHPSPLSVSKPMKSYPAFCEYDIFNEINKLLHKYENDTIDWKKILS